MHTPQRMTLILLVLTKLSASNSTSLMKLKIAQLGDFFVAYIAVNFSKAHFHNVPIAVANLFAHETHFSLSYKQF